ncbi:hypothetical protein HYC85_024486 [Camellia sinensis]|uniref:Uncharacterized protein n=1 Tax=Camellia sinensis TaxID=4442 RepID=A0A7J7G887_CAMSI|nr:hypothetical protein HYC85_024486 [Camellia sinensis]
MSELYDTRSHYTSCTHLDPICEPRIASIISQNDVCCSYFTCPSPNSSSEMVFITPAMFDRHINLAGSTIFLLKVFDVALHFLKTRCDCLLFGNCVDVCIAECDR